jgi:hypothetical protein
MNRRKKQPGIAQRLRHAAQGVERETFSLIDVIANLRRSAQELERIAQEIRSGPEALRRRKVTGQKPSQGTKL